MNFEFYIVESRKDFEIIPRDSSENELQRCVSLHRNDETLVISHEWEMMHYVYLRRIGGGKDYFGFCISFNGVSFRRIESVFGLMEQLFDTAVFEGLMIHVTDSGQLTFNQTGINEQIAHHTRLYQEAKKIINTFHKSEFGPPPSKYHYGRSESYISMAEGDEGLESSLMEHDRVAVVRETAGLELNNIQNRIRKLHEQTVEWEQKYNKEHKKKKQYSLVILLLLLLLIGGAAAVYLIRENLFRIENLEQTVESRDAAIDMMQKKIESQSKHIDKLNDSTEKQFQRIAKMEDDQDKMANKLSRYANIIHSTGLPPDVTSSKNFSSGYVMWLYAWSPAVINRMWIRSTESGRVRIVLYDENGYFVDDEYVSVQSVFSRCYMSLKIPRSGYYYLAIEDYGNLMFQYTNTTKATYNAFESESLKIIGCCKQGKSYSSANQTDYHYFYSINYRVTL